MRVLIAEDETLMREGLARLLTDAGMEVVGRCGDADALRRLVEARRPDVALVDIRMPPGHGDDGLVAAQEIRRTYPDTAVLLLSHHLEARYAMRLLEETPERVGYLLKERVSDVDEFIDALHRVSSGGTAIDPDLVTRLIARPHKGHSPGDDLTDREKSVLELMAEGRTNQAIGKSLFLGERTVEAHIRSIFLKLDLRPEPEDHRRVLAVLTYLRGVGQGRGSQ